MHTAQLLYMSHPKKARLFLVFYAVCYAVLQSESADGRKANDVTDGTHMAQRFRAEASYKKAVSKIIVKSGGLYIIYMLVSYAAMSIKWATIGLP